jgi:hypothetical protein
MWLKRLPILSLPIYYDGGSNDYLQFDGLRLTENSQLVPIRAASEMYTMFKLTANSIAKDKTREYSRAGKAYQKAREQLTLVEIELRRVPIVVLDEEGRLLRLNLTIEH